MDPVRAIDVDLRDTLEPQPGGRVLVESLLTETVTRSLESGRPGAVVVHAGGTGPSHPSILYSLYKTFKHCRPVRSRDGN